MLPVCSPGHGGPYVQGNKFTLTPVTKILENISSHFPFTLTGLQQHNIQFLVTPNSVFIWPTASLGWTLAKPSSFGWLWFEAFLSSHQRWEKHWQQFSRHPFYSFFKTCHKEQVRKQAVHIPEERAKSRLSTSPVILNDFRRGIETLSCFVLASKNEELHNCSPHQRWE